MISAHFSAEFGKPKTYPVKPDGTFEEDDRLVDTSNSRGRTENGEQQRPGHIHGEGRIDPRNRTGRNKVSR